MGSNDSASDTDEADAASGAYAGCRDVESLAPLQQILPYGSQLRDTTSSAGRAWVNADIREDEQVRRAVAQVEPTIRQHSGTQPLVLSADSDGSVTGRDVAGSAAIFIETADGEVVAMVRLAPTDMALSSGRTEWVGLVMVFESACGPPPHVFASPTRLNVGPGFRLMAVPLKERKVDATARTSMLKACCALPRAHTDPHLTTAIRH